MAVSNLASDSTLSASKKKKRSKSNPRGKFNKVILVGALSMVTLF